MLSIKRPIKRIIILGINIKIFQITSPTTSKKLSFKNSLILLLFFILYLFTLYLFILYLPIIHFKLSYFTRFYQNKDIKTARKLLHIIPF